ncbi:hypothetical protein PRIC2_012602 [Phytophthora ramorum]
MGLSLFWYLVGVAEASAKVDSSTKATSSRKADSGSGSVWLSPSPPLSPARTPFVPLALFAGLLRRSAKLEETSQAKRQYPLSASLPSKTSESEMAQQNLAPKRVFSFKDAVVRSSAPKEQVAQIPSPKCKTSCSNDAEKKPTRTRMSRSRSITKIVESSSFKKRCEALKSHPSRKNLDKKGEDATRKSAQKLTPLEELCAREKQHSIESCTGRNLREAHSPSEKADKSSQDRVLLRRASLPMGAPSDSDTQESLSSSSCESSPVKAVASANSHCKSSRKSRCSSPPRRKVDSDEEFFDCDDSTSESTAESSCASPRHLNLHKMETCQEDDELSNMLAKCDEDEEAYMLLDRITNLSEEFAANREYEESNALSWSVQHAAQQGAISTQLQQNLFANICDGLLDDARDVLYHKCHLVPAVGSVVESPTQPTMEPSAVQTFGDFVDAISPTDALAARMHKLQVLKQLSDLLTKWVKMVGRERELSEEHITLTKGSLFLAGSYRLGLDDPNSDIDAVCVVPWHVTHDDFFGSFCRLLEHTPGVSHLAPVPNAYVPLISLSFLGVRMDLLFARLPLSSVEPNQNIDSDHMLVGVHETSMKALNAPRVSSMLLCLVPRRREYRIVLRAVRAWARRRGIYSAKLGYLGGISWAILVAFVCQLYPNAEPAKIFVRFFQVLSEWQWPQPVMLNMIYDAGLGFDMWDPRQSVFDRSHIMPIITPAYPHMNSSVQVSQPTFSVIYEELWRARYLAEIAVGISKPFPTTAPSPESSDVDLKAAVVCMATSMPSFDQPLNAVQSDTEAVQAVGDAGAWDKLFQPSNFFIRYSSYMVFNFQADSESAMHKWGKFVQSRLRKLVDNLHHMSPVSRVHAFPRYFPHTCDAERQGPGSCMFIGIEFHHRRHQSIQPKDDPEVKKTLEQTIRFFLATDLQQMEDKQPDMTADAKVVSWEELPEFVFRLGRSKAELERAKYTGDLEKMGFSQSNTPSFRPPYYVNRYNRNGKWRSGGGPRKYAGGQRKQHRDFRNAPRSFPVTQAG